MNCSSSSSSGALTTFLSTGIFIGTASIVSLYHYLHTQKDPSSNIAIVGLCTVDIHAYPVENLPKPGFVSFIDEINVSVAGTAGGTAVVCQKLGMNVQLRCAVGRDFMGDVIVKSLLLKHNIDTSGLQLLEEYPTSSTVINVEPKSGGRPCLHHLGAADHLALSRDDMISLCRSNKYLHIGGLGLVAKGGEYERSIEPLLRIANEHGVVTSLDIIAPHANTLQHLMEVLPLVDYFLPSLEEAEIISQLKSQEIGTVGEYFMGLGVRKACIFKAGEKGSYLICRRESIIDQQMSKVAASSKSVIHTSLSGSISCYRVLGFDLSSIPEALADELEKINRSSSGGRNWRKSSGDDINGNSSSSSSSCGGRNCLYDTTGCGDTYVSGFLAALSRGLDISDALRFGTATSALCATGLGSDAGSKDWSFVERFISEVPLLEERMQDTPHTPETSYGPVTAGGTRLFSPPPSSKKQQTPLASRLRSLIHGGAVDSDDDYMSSPDIDMIQKGESATPTSSEVFRSVNRAGSMDSTMSVPTTTPASSNGESLKFYSAKEFPRNAR